MVASTAATSIATSRPRRAARAAARRRRREEGGSERTLRPRCRQAGARVPVVVGGELRTHVRRTRGADAGSSTRADARSAQRPSAPGVGRAMGVASTSWSTATPRSASSCRSDGTACCGCASFPSTADVDAAISSFWRNSSPPGSARASLHEAEEDLGEHVSRPPTAGAGTRGAGAGASSGRRRRGRGRRSGGGPFAGSSKEAVRRAAAQGPWGDGRRGGGRRRGRRRRVPG